MAERLPRWVRVAGHLFGWTAAAVFGLYLGLTDWGWYADLPHGRELMFETPWWQRLVESGVVGLLAGGAVSGPWLYAGWFWSRLGWEQGTPNPSHGHRVK